MPTAEPRTTHAKVHKMLGDVRITRKHLEASPAVAQGVAGYAAHVRASRLLARIEKDLKDLHILVEKDSTPDVIERVMSKPM